MKKMIHSLLLSLLTLHLVNSVCLGAFSEKEQQWLQNMLIKPSPNLIFIVTVNKEMLEPQPGPGGKTVPSVDYSEMTDDLLNKYIERNALEADGYIQMYQRLQRAKKYEQSNQVLSLALTRILGGLEKDSTNWQLVKEALEIYQAVNQKGKGKKLLATFLEINPDNTKALLALANVEILTSDFAGARTHIDKAYELSPLDTDLYISEFLYQLYYGLVELNKMPDRSKPVIMPIATDFFIKADKDNSSLETPRMMEHGLQVLQVFYSVIFREIDRFKSNTSFDFVLDDQLTKTAAEAKTYFQQAVRKKENNLYFSKLFLLMIAIVENDQRTANLLYKDLVLHSAADNNLHRLMVINDISKARLHEAINHLTASITLHDNIEDRLMLAGVYQMANNSSLSLKTLMDYRGELSREILVHRLGYSLLAGDSSFAVGLYQNYRKIKPLWGDPLFAYYAVIFELLQGKDAEAKNILQSLPLNTVFYTNAEGFAREFQ
jgi:tetratricopeptide (TPR) repeat protein